MKRLALLLLLAACNSFPSADDCQDDPGARHHGLNPATGACWEFDSSCDVPEAWVDCEDEPPPPDAAEVPDAGPPPPDGAMCTGGAICTWDTDCPTGQWCDGGLSGDPCDPSVPGCGIPVPIAGVCTCGTRPGDPTRCAVTTDCGTGELCPAEYGGPDMCERACYGDFDCTSGERCNAPDLVPYCPQPNFKRSPRLLIACAGWCVPL